MFHWVFHCMLLLIEKGEMERSLQELVNYERLRSKYRDLFLRTMETQTEGLSDIQSADGGCNESLGTCDASVSAGKFYEDIKYTV